jgi:pyrroloquinoline quinone biosynthesis protein D
VEPRFERWVKAFDFKDGFGRCGAMNRTGAASSAAPHEADGERLQPRKQKLRTLDSARPLMTRFSGHTTDMPPPEDSSQPRLAAGCRWSTEKKTAENKTGERTLLYPEGALRLRDTGLQILERCDGQRSFAQIIEELQAQFNAADPAKIRADISQFLEQLRHKRIVDY